MPGPSIEDLQAALNDYKAKTDTWNAKRVVRDDKAEASRQADAELATAQSEFVAAGEAVIESELTLQRLNDEHTPDVGAE